MKKLFLTLLVTFVALVTYGQTTTTVSPSKDTVITTLVPAVYTPEKYTPGQYIPPSYTPSSFTPASVSVVIKAYKAPVTPVVTPPVVTPPSPTTITYTKSGPVTCQSNMTYQNIWVDLTGTVNTNGFSVNGKSNVTIINCKVTGGNGTAYWVGGSSSNININNCFASSVGAAFYAENSSTVKFNYNQVLNVNGNTTNFMFGHAFQFNNVSGGGNQVNYNRVENVAGVAINPHDVVSIYKSNGLKGDSIQVIGNWFRGGQRALTSTGGGGACGITITDVTGSYQVVRGNILVNTGYAGIQCIGTGFGVKIDHNITYSSNTPVSLLGFSIQDATQIDCGYNDTYWMNAQGVTTPNGVGVPQYWLSSSPTPLNWSTNKWNDKTIDPTKILPAVIITKQ